MTFAYATLTFGAILIYSALTGKPIADVILGVGPPGAVSTDPTLGSETNVGKTGGGMASVSSNAKGIGSWHGEPVCNWIVDILKAAAKDGVDVHVLSGFRTRAQQVAACAQTSGPCADPGTSNHEGCTGGRGAIDIASGDKAKFDAWLAKHGHPLVSGDKISDPNHYSKTGH